MVSLTMKDMDFVVKRMCMGMWYVHDRLLHDTEDVALYLLRNDRDDKKAVVPLDGKLLRASRQEFVERIWWRVDFECRWAYIVVRDDGGDPGDEC